MFTEALGEWPMPKEDLHTQKKTITGELYRELVEEPQAMRRRLKEQEDTIRDLEMEIEALKRLGIGKDIEIKTLIEKYEKMLEDQRVRLEQLTEKMVGETIADTRAWLEEESRRKMEEALYEQQQAMLKERARLLQEQWDKLNASINAALEDDDDDKNRIRSLTMKVQELERQLTEKTRLLEEKVHQIAMLCEQKDHERHVALDEKEKSMLKVRAQLLKEKDDQEKERLARLAEDMERQKEEALEALRRQLQLAHECAVEEAVHAREAELREEMARKLREQQERLEGHMNEQQARLEAHLNDALADDDDDKAQIEVLRKRIRILEEQIHADVDAAIQKTKEEMLRVRMKLLSDKDSAHEQELADLKAAKKRKKKVALEHLEHKLNEDFEQRLREALQKLREEMLAERKAAIEPLQERIEQLQEAWDRCSCRDAMLFAWSQKSPLSPKHKKK